MTSNLCSLEHARLNVSGATSDDDRTLDAMLAATGDAIRAYCRRRFALGRYDEVLDGVDSPLLLLREAPVVSVESVRSSPRVVLEVTNTSAANQQARVAVALAGLELSRVASGTRAVDTSVTWSPYATLQSVASAVGAVGNGWAARAAPGYELFPSSDLYVAPFGEACQSQGALACRGLWAGLTLHVAEAAGYCWDARGRLYRRDPAGDLSAAWCGGPGAWRVQYTAGFAEVPEAVQEACAQWAAELFRLTQRDPALATLALVGSVSQTFVHDGMPPRVRALLAPYRRFVV